MKSFLAFFGVSIVLGISGCQAGSKETLLPKEFNIKMELPETQLVDVRTVQEFDLGFILGAENIDINNTEFIKNCSKLDKEKPVALYCESGSRSENAMNLLSKEGFKILYALKGGLIAWEKEGNKLVIPKPAEEVKTNMSKLEFEKLIVSDKLVIVEFGAEWCGPCKMLKPVLDKISTEYGSMGVKIVTIDVDQSKELSNELRVNEIPLLLFYKNGKIMERMLGFNPESIIKESIEKQLL